VSDRGGFGVDPHRTFGCMIGRMAAGAADKPHDRADVDDRPATSLCHLLGGELGAKEHAGLVDGDDTMPALQSVRVPDRTAGNAGVVHQDIQSVVACLHVGDQIDPLRPLWAAAQDLDIPVGMHIATNRPGPGQDFGLEDRNRVRNSFLANADHWVRMSLADMIFSGVFERYPKLQVGTVEHELSWIWLDATYLKQREGGRIVSVAAIIAVAANTDGRREIVGLHIGPSEAETFWSTFLKSLARRGLRGVKLVISDAHEGLKAAIRRVFGAGWQRCRVHWMRNALAYVPKTQQSMVAAALRQAFLQPDRAQASAMLRHVADQLRPKWPKLAAFIDDSETDVLCFLDFPEPHRSKLHSTNPLERLNKEVKRRADVVGICPNEAAIIRLIGAALLDQHYQCQLHPRYMQVEVMAELAAAASASDPRQIPCAA